MVSMPRYALNTRGDRSRRRGLVWSGMSGIGWMIAVSSLPDGLVRAPASSCGCREVAHQHTHACNFGGDPHGG